MFNMILSRSLLFFMLLSVFACRGQGSLVSKINCDFLEGIPANGIMECGKIEVPENHDDPQGKKLLITYVVLKSKDQKSASYPLIYFSGGPGGASLTPRRIKNWLQHPVREKRDIILFDQRGIGHSSSLPNMESALYQIMADDLSASEEQSAVQNLLEKQRKKCENLGHNLKHFNTFQNARDVGVLMDVLGYPKYNLYGVSYGTRLARVVQDLFPDLINSVTHNSPAPMSGDFLIDRLQNYTRALQKIFSYCDNNPQCLERYPNLKDTYLEAIKSLQKQPIELDLDGKIFHLNAQDALYLLRRRLYGNDSRSRVPELIMAYYDRRGQPIKEVIRFEYLFSDYYNSSMWLAVERSEMFDLKNTPEVINEIYKNASLLPTRMGMFNALYIAAKNWHNFTLTSQEKQFKISKVPTLITVNQFDPVTPPAYGHLFKERLPNGQLYILDEGGHGGGNAMCRAKVMIDFMDNPKGKLDTSCLNIYKD